MREIKSSTIESRFRKNHLCPEDQRKVEDIRKAAIAFGKTLAANCPQGRCLTIAVTRLEEAVSFAKSSVYRNAAR